jgi:serine protease Do
MKRFLSFLLFVLLLSLGVGALQVWKDGREGVPIHGLFSRFFERDAARRRNRPEKYTVADGPRINLKDVDVLAAMSRQRVLLARTVVPSVVSITTSKAVRRQPYMDDPLFQFFHHGRSQSAQRTFNVGSGVIVSKEGHIVTNHHVIEDMEDIEVELSDGRKKDARLIGADSTTDIAVLKIDAHDLQPLPFGDSELVEVGETVMTVGNPYGVLEESVTQGIISAKGRTNEMLSNLLQTDAAINPGNSGGPLVNVRGELIGINEAIYSQSGGWQGVGFAIPSATVRRTMDSILQTGQVIHGYLGVNLQPLTPDTARERGLPDANGALVEAVMPDSPAESAKIRSGDFIKKFNNKPVGSVEDLRRKVAEIEVNSTVPIELLRDAKTLIIDAKITEKPPAAQLAQVPRRQRSRQPSFPVNPPGGDADSSPGNGNILSAVKVAELTPAETRKLGLPAGVEGVVVQSVEANSAAAGPLKAGDVIEQINRLPVASSADYQKLAGQLPADEPVLLSIVRERVRSLVVIKPPEP